MDREAVGFRHSMPFRERVICTFLLTPHLQMPVVVNHCFLVEALAPSYVVIVGERVEPAQQHRGVGRLDTLPRTPLVRVHDMVPPTDRMNFGFFRRRPPIAVEPFVKKLVSSQRGIWTANGVC